MAREIKGSFGNMKITVRGIIENKQHSIQVTNNKNNVTKNILCIRGYEQASKEYIEGSNSYNGLAPFREYYKKGQTRFLEAIK